MAQKLTAEQLAKLAMMVERDRLYRAHITIDEAAERAPMSPVTWSRVEAGKTVRGLTYAGVERSLGWADGSIDRWAKTGQPPVPMADQPLPADESTEGSAEGSEDSTLDELYDAIFKLDITPSRKRRMIARLDQLVAQESGKRTKVGQ